MQESRAFFQFNSLSRHPDQQTIVQTAKGEFTAAHLTDGFSHTLCFFPAS